MAKVEKSLKLGAGLVFGLLIPCVLLFYAVTGIKELPGAVEHKGSLESVVKTFSTARETLVSENDYAFLSMLAAENANQKAMLNKQVMKVTVIQIGFAVISLGLLFIVLGFNEGGVSASGGASEVTFDIKTGSTGLAAIIIGASMVTVGGLQKNEYYTVSVPLYHSSQTAIKNQLTLMLQSCTKSYKGAEEANARDKCFTAAVSKRFQLKTK